MEIAKEDLLHIIESAANRGEELTLDEVIEILKEVKPDIEIADAPGLVTLIKELKKGL